jgi:voltage-gated potassium channel
VKLAQYEARTSPALTVLAVVFLLLYGIQVTIPGLPAWVIAVAGTLESTIWVLFAADLAIRVYLAERKLQWLARHPIDVLTVAMPMLRPLRILRVFTAGHSLLTRRGGLGQSGLAILVSAAVLVLVGALAVLDAERDAPGAIIVTFGDALWWSVTTVTTVGYGDLYPVSAQGRLVATMLMIVGISVIGVVTATVAAWFVDLAERGRKENAARQAAESTTEEDQRASQDDAASFETPSGLSDSDYGALLAMLHRAGVLTDDETRRAVLRISNLAESTPGIGHDAAISQDR